MKRKNKKNICTHCSLYSVKYKCLLCNCTGKIEMPKNVIWNSNKISDLTIVGACYITCDECKGKGWILMPPFIAELHPENIFNGNK